MELAIVTGAGAGLGRAIALGLAGEGTGVLVADVDEPAAEETAALVRARGVPGYAMVADVRDRDAAARVVEAAVGAGGPHSRRV
jgi:NAD(P)-dependent dehydrogenase (short-subunit alcohol dehydrogenase family)